METKRLILSISITLALVLGWQALRTHLIAEHPGWVKSDDQQANPAAPTVSPAVSPATATTLPSTLPVAMGTAPASATTLPTASGGLAAVGSTQPSIATLGANPTVYPVKMTIDPQGAGLQSVILPDYYVTAAHDKPYIFQQPLTGFESLTRPLATRTVTVNGTDIDTSGLIWKQVESSASSATYAATVLEAGTPELEVTKKFTVSPRDAADGSRGFDVAVHQSFRNLTAKIIKVSITLNGPVPAARENDLSEDRRYVAGYDDGDKTVEIGSTMVSELKKDKPAKDMVAVDTRPMLWIGACNSYFDSIVRPDANPAIKIVSAIAAPIDPGTILTAGESPTSLSLYTNDFGLAPGAIAPFDLHVFLGPKVRELLDSPYYAAFPLHYDKTLVYSSGPCGYITFSWLITVLSGILWFFHMIFRDWGLAIIGLVCLVRLMLHPITKKAQINMVSMGKMGPEIERLKKKYGDNKDELNKAMINVYKEQGMTPILGCLPMFLQTPIWIALWSALQSTFELRQAGFLRWQHLHLTWISDLSHPDALISFAQPVSLLGFFHITSLNVLPMLLAVVFFLQQHMQPMPANMTPEQEQQRKMMKWMSLLFPVMLYGRASGLSLYILTSTSIGIIENKIIRDHIKQRDEAEKAGRIIIDASPTRNSKRKDDDKKLLGGKAASAKQGGIAGWISDLQTKFEEIRREADRRGKDRS
jgi:YidC/Oxa1 family membrane protein insertase